jgi:hypothetical protein
MGVLLCGGAGSRWTGASIEDVDDEVNNEEEVTTVVFVEEGVRAACIMGEYAAVCTEGCGAGLVTGAGGGYTRVGGGGRAVVDGSLWDDEDNDERALGVFEVVEGPLRIGACG